ncbi:superantigen-like protein [Staphylococcus agnetis]|uniref:exotoxin beta-grasp domain-containing protein n=1 Tax=Staphylococcus agnetis TaxID=985762 RepID=UPI0021D0B03C|nr:exotoxin beta-grasp domain-containing protein [Staphylococcus agnetis]UXU64292.1 superantigen-like protein [Staphylococcus agnetis]UXU66632.1 superantigen-like protein [Staphylococcus agnetis]
MKLSTIAKTSLALGILTTGVITTNAQPADAAQIKNSQQTTQNTNELYEYYKKGGFDIYDVTGFKSGNKLEIVDSKSKQLTNVILKGKDKDRYHDGEIPNLNVFVVKENNSRFSENVSIGGVTFRNNENYTDWVSNPPLTLKQTKDNAILDDYIGRFPILKKEISLKELDFKLRKLLIEKHGLYTNGNNKGVITVRMKERNINNDYYSFVLDNKLQEDRMGDVIDATKIDRIDVEYKK